MTDKLTLNMELTTYCNSRCDFCTHEEMIATGKRPLQHMDLEDAKHYIDEMKKRWPEPTYFIPVGLGEPLLYPHLIEVLDYAKKTWPNAQLIMNTNGSMLAERGIGLIGRLDLLTISLCYPTRVNYERHLGLDWHRTNQSIRDFLLAKGSLIPLTKIHIFGFIGNKLFFPLHYARWWKYLGEKDYCSIYKFISLVGQPCDLNPQPENFVVDVEGNLYNSCMGVWYPFEETKHLCIGTMPKTLITPNEHNAGMGCPK